MARNYEHEGLLYVLLKDTSLASNDADMEFSSLDVMASWVVRHPSPERTIVRPRRLEFVENVDYRTEAVTMDARNVELSDASMVRWASVFRNMLMKEACESESANDCAFADRLFAILSVAGKTCASPAMRRWVWLYGALRSLHWDDELDGIRHGAVLMERVCRYMNGEEAKDVAALNRQIRDFFGTVGRWNMSDTDVVCDEEIHRFGTSQWEEFTF